MPKEISPTVLWITIAVVVLVVVGIGYKMFGSGGFHADTTGSEEAMQKVKNGQPMYQPPKVPGLPGQGGPGGSPMLPPMGGPPMGGGRPGAPMSIPTGPGR